MPATAPARSSRPALRLSNVLPVDQVMVELAASSGKRSVKADATLTGLKLAAAMIDLTTLEEKDSRAMWLP